MQKIIKDYLYLIDSFLESHSYGQQPAELYKPIDYIMSLGGKRIRPLLVLLSYGLFKTDVEKIIEPALSVEVFHNFTLMHDDIMDKAPLRRGAQTVHTKWNENVAILSGDVMLVKAYDLLMNIESDNLKLIMNTFNHTAAAVCEGQQMDMNFEEKEEVNIESYLEMIKLKTAVLLGYSLKLGAMLADADIDDYNKLETAGINMGIGFQLMDDLLDVYADKEKFGKQVGGDIIANKKTFLYLKSLELASEHQKDELKRWFSLTDVEPIDKVDSVKSIYDQLDIRQKTQQEIERYFEDGMQLIERVNTQTEGKNILMQYIKYLINRDK
jgi:geranylgeranyl diphosphate synthase type II